MKKYLADIRLEPYAGYQAGYEATVIGLKARDAIAQGEKIAIGKEILALA